MALVNGDPSADIAAIENVETVFEDDVGYDAAKLLDAAKRRHGQYEASDQFTVVRMRR